MCYRNIAKFGPNNSKCWTSDRPSGRPPVVRGKKIATAIIPRSLDKTRDPERPERDSATGPDDGGAANGDTRVRAEEQLLPSRISTAMPSAVDQSPDLHELEDMMDDIIAETGSTTGTGSTGSGSSAAGGGGAGGGAGNGGHASVAAALPGSPTVGAADGGGGGSSGGKIKLKRSLLTFKDAGLAVTIVAIVGPSHARRTARSLCVCQLERG